VSGNFTHQYHFDLNHSLEKLARASHSPMAFVLGEAIDNFVKLNLEQNQAHPQTQETDTGRDADSIIGGYI